MGKHTPPYNFGGLPERYTREDKAKIAIVPVAFDLTSSWMAGSRFGPRALIEASAYIELYDTETQTEVVDHGVLTAPEVTAESTQALNEKVYQAVTEQLDAGRFTVTLGGEHSVAFGAYQAHHERHENLSVLHLDAHTDRRNEFEGDPFNHACTLRRISELNPDILSVGIRSLDRSELEFLDFDNVWFAKDIHGALDWIPGLVGRLQPNVYLTFDLDVFDPGIMSSTGTPEPGGMDWYTALALLRAVIRARTLVGFDVVELKPVENNKAPDFMAAKLVYKLLSYIFEQKRND
jgi:agmatinase